MTDVSTWRDAVVVVRAQAIDAQIRDPASRGRATVFNFHGSGGSRTWIGRASLAPAACTGAHHHGRHEVMVHVLAGRAEIRWGDGLRYAADIAAGDSAYFLPEVPHQERNLSEHETVEFLVVRSDNERIVVPLEFDVTEHPQRVV